MREWDAPHPTSTSSTHPMPGTRLEKQWEGRSQGFCLLIVQQWCGGVRVVRGVLSGCADLI